MNVMLLFCKQGPCLQNSSKVCGANQRPPLKGPTDWLADNQFIDLPAESARHAIQGQKGDADKKVGGGFGDKGWWWPPWLPPTLDLMIKWEGGTSG